MSAHTCHAFNCERAVPPSKLMCPMHWRMVPKSLQDLLWREYRPGQERRMNPSVPYCLAAADCVRAVASKEGYDMAIVEDDPAVAGYLALIQMMERD